MPGFAASSPGRAPVIVSRPALTGAGLLVALVVAAALWRGDAARAPSLAPVLQTRSLIFADRAADGAVVVTDAADRQVVAVETGQLGFLRQTMRGLALDRQAQGGNKAAPFTLTYYTDRRFILRDPQTGREVELEAFGPTNEAVFARLLRR